MKAYKTLSGSDLVLCARCDEFNGKPTKTEVYRAKEDKLERSGFVFDRPSDSFRSVRVHRWRSSDRNFRRSQLLLKHLQTLWLSSQVWDTILKLQQLEAVSEENDR